jgi:hypothetical protein
MNITSFGLKLIIYIVKEKVFFGYEEPLPILELDSKKHDGRL